MQQRLTRHWGVTSAAIVLLLAILFTFTTPLYDSSAPPMLLLQARSIFPRLSGQVGRAGSLLGLTAHKPLASSSTPTSLIQSSLHNQRLYSSDNMTHDTTNFKEAVQHRRTIYQLTKKSTISDEKIKDILTTAVEHVPSSFNSQSARLVVLLKEEHTKVLILSSIHGSAETFTDSSL